MKNGLGMWLRLLVLLVGTFLLAIVIQWSNIGSWEVRILLIFGFGLLLGVVIKTLDVRKFIVILTNKYDEK